MELIGTEVAPDWHCYSGDQAILTGEYRATNAVAVLLRSSTNELRRYAAHAPDPNRRFHYRYQAAGLCWEAAKLLPNNNDLTAYVLWQGGSFLKYLDRQT